MGKVTHHRVQRITLADKIPPLFGVFGGVLFLIGSVLCFPSFGEQQQYLGAALFLGGSLAYTIAPLLDYWNMVENYGSHSELPSKISGPPNENFEALYKALVLRSQKFTALMYAMTGLAFTIGSMYLFWGINEAFETGPRAGSRGGTHADCAFRLPPANPPPGARNIIMTTWPPPSFMQGYTLSGAWWASSPRFLLA